MRGCVLLLNLLLKAAAFRPITKFSPGWGDAKFRTSPMTARESRRTHSARRRRREGKPCPPPSRNKIDSNSGALEQLPIRASKRENSSVFVVPEHARDPEYADQPIQSHVQFISLEKLFPEAPQLEELFHTDSNFRSSIRSAARDDLWRFDPRHSAEKNLQLRACGSTLEGNWLKSGECKSLTRVFTLNGITGLSGLNFMRRIGSLSITGGDITAAIELTQSGSNVDASSDFPSSPCSQSYPVTGSWLDIVTPRNGRRFAAHAWHQDSGLKQWTTMLGFPSSNNFTGEGVFSHCVMLSHAMSPPVVPGPVIFEPPQEGKSVFPEEAVLRPTFRRGAEIIVYCDRDHVHSAPDEFRRDGIWRFM